MRINTCDNIIIMLAGLLTFSLAFYVIVIIYILMAPKRHSKVITALFVAIILALIILPNIEFKNNNINALINRFSIENGEWVGDDRSNETIEQLLEETLSSFYALFGMGGGYVDSLHIEKVGTYKKFIIDYGIVGIFIMYIPLIIHAFKRCNKNYYAIIYVICFIASIYQRASIFMMACFVILFGGIEYIKSDGHQVVEKEKQKIENNVLH